MTDGEYNEQYSGSDSVTQAKATCDAMKANNIQIYSIGFGFSSTSVRGSNTAEGRAMDVLYYCATDASHYFVPYDGTALRTAFQNIGNSLTTQMTTNIVQHGSRILR